MDMFTLTLHKKKGGLLMKNIYILKKDGTREPYNSEKILRATGKSARRVMVTLSDGEQEYLISEIERMIKLKGIQEIPVAEMHIFVENALARVSPQVAESYRSYRDNMKAFAELLDNCFVKANEIQYDAQAEEEKNPNANADSTLVSTKRCLIFNVFNKELYRRFFLTKDEIAALNAGFIYIQDESARRDTMNCCLFDLEAVIKGGFYSSAAGGIWYNEPKSLDVFGDVAGDVILMAASQQYGGFTVCEIDKIMEPYAQKTFDSVYERVYRREIRRGISEVEADEDAREEAYEQVEKEMRGCFQGWEMKFNTVASSRGDYPFITFTYGLARGEFGKMAAKICSETRGAGQGRKGVRNLFFSLNLFFYTIRTFMVRVVNWKMFLKQLWHVHRRACILIGYH